ncbi:hypothetical protein HMPREF0555_0893, partial [Leuconostoc mesenteroides subsp. cremoris ATCC 19254]
LATDQVQRVQRLSLLSQLFKSTPSMLINRLITKSSVTHLFRSMQTNYFIK